MTGDHLPPGLALAWGATPGGVRRGPKPAHSVDSVVAAAIAVADAEGFAALSMPRIARQLKITANALYRYVASKDELLVLMVDAAWGVPPHDLGGTWRDACTAWTHAMRDVLLARPWLLDVPGRGAPATPNLLRWMEVFLSSMDGCGLDPAATMECLILLDGYARNTAKLHFDLAGQPGDAVGGHVAEFLVPRLRERGYPRLAAMMARGTYGEWPPKKDAVGFGLRRILDGIEVLIERSS